MHMCLLRGKESGKHESQTEKLIQSNCFRQCDFYLGCADDSSASSVASSGRSEGPCVDARPCVVHPQAVFFLC